VKPKRSAAPLAITGIAWIILLDERMNVRSSTSPSP
jgi:hypothetical protein